MGSACGASGGGKGVHSVVVGKPEGKRPLGRPRHRWRIILRWNFEKFEGVETGCSWLRIEIWWALVNTVMKILDQ